jgi:Zn-dependent peptidase ImmA (M78 family)
MQKKIVNRIDRNLCRRLREARQEAGLSIRAVADKLPKRSAVSYVTISSYEKGASVPPVDVLAALADLYGRTLNWFLEDRDALAGFRYRNEKSGAGILDKKQFEATAAKWVDADLNLEKHLKQPLVRRIREISASSTIPAETLAAMVRAELELDDRAPIPNMVDVLETCAIRVLELRTSLPIDGVAAKRGSHFVIVLNPNVKGDRLRMNSAHELAHVLYDDCKNDLYWSDNAVEKRAHEFASSLLLPTEQLRKAFEGKSFLRLLQYKEKFGISLSAMVYRAEKQKIIPSTTARRLWTEMSKRGWKREEPGYVWKDRAIRFETLLDSAIQTRAITWEEAERVTGIRQEQLQQRLDEVFRNDRSESEALEGGEAEAQIIRMAWNAQDQDESKVI